MHKIYANLAEITLLTLHESLVSCEVFRATANLPTSRQAFMRLFTVNLTAVILRACILDAQLSSPALLVCSQSILTIQY